MVMALSLFQHEGSLYVVAGYESGHTKVYRDETVGDTWKEVYSHQSHSQPGKVEMKGFSPPDYPRQ